MDEVEACPEPEQPLDGGYAPVPRALADSLGYLLHRGRVRAQAVAKQSLPPGVHPRDYPVLASLGTADFGSQLELAEALSVNRTIMVGLVDQLADQGYVDRRRNPADRRRYLLELTAAGRQHVARLRAAVTEGNARFTQALSASEVERVNALLRPVALQRLGDEVPESLFDLTAFLVVHSHFRMLQLASGPEMARLHLQPRQHGVLAVLDDLGPLPQYRIGEELQVGSATVVEMVDTLEKRGRVERRPGAEDRRTNEVVLTARGRRDLTKAAALIAKVELEATADLTAPERRELVVLLRRLVTGS